MKRRKKGRTYYKELEEAPRHCFGRRKRKKRGSPIFLERKKNG